MCRFACHTKTGDGPSFSENETVVRPRFWHSSDRNAVSVGNLAIVSAGKSASRKAGYPTAFLENYFTVSPFSDLPGIVIKNSRTTNFYLAKIRIISHADLQDAVLI